MFTQKQIANYYDQFNPLYQIYHCGSYGLHFGYYINGHESHKEAILNVNRVMTQQAKIKAGDKILDAGCGIGGSSIWLAKNFPVDVVGITISEKQLATAKKLAEPASLKGTVNFQLMDYLHTDFKDNSFDVIWAIETVCYAQNKLDFLKEAHRVLKKGGHLIVSDAFLERLPHTMHEEKIVQDFYTGFLLDNLATLESFNSDLKKAGFKKSDYFDRKKEIRRAVERAGKYSRFAHPLTKLFAGVTPLTKAIDDTVTTGLAFDACIKENLITHGEFLAFKI